MGAVQARLLAWALLAALAAAPAEAQPAPPGAAPAPAAPAPAPATPEPLAPEPIPLPDVAGAAEDLARWLAEVRDRAAPDAALQAIAEALPARARRLEGGAERTREALAELVSLDRLADLDRAWLAERDALAQTREVVTVRATEFEALLEELDALAEVWTLTARSAGEAPPAVREQIATARRELREARTLVSERRSAILTLQAQLSEREQAVDELLREIDARRAEVRSQVLRRDSPPWWEVLPGLAEPGRLLEQLATAAQRDAALLRASTRRPDLAVGVVALFGFWLMLALLARRGMRRLTADDREVEHAGEIFERPTSAALLVTVVTAYLLLGGGPLQGMLRLLVVVPALRLLPRVVEPTMRPAVYALVGFYVVNLARDVLASAPLLERAVYLVELTVALAVLLWLLRPSRLARLPADFPFARPLSVAVRVAACLLAAAAVANVLGYTVLAQLLGQGTFAGAFGFVLLFGTARVLRAGLRVGLRSRLAQRLRMVRAHAPLLMRRGSRLIDVLAVGAWVFILLEGFDLRDPAQQRVAAALDSTLEVGAASVSLGGVLAFVITLLGAWAISRTLRFSLQEEVFPRLAMGRGVAHATSITVHYALLMAGFVLAIAAAGIDLDRFTLLAGALGVGVGFGLQNVVNNFVSGLILLYERPVQVGDTVEMGTLMGEVRRIGIRSSTVRTWQGAEVIVPNATLIAEPVVNWTLSDRQRRMDIPVGVAYGSDPEKVTALLAGVARANPEVMDDPAPLVLFLGFGESSLDFELRAWSARFERAHITRSELVMAVHAALRDAGIEIPFPQRDVHVRSVPERSDGEER